jgi:hypothetical protein
MTSAKTSFGILFCVLFSSGPARAQPNPPPTQPRKPPEPRPEARKPPEPRPEARKPAKPVDKPAKRPTIKAKARVKPKKRKFQVSYLGPAREISHSSSASRDTFVLGLMVAPRPVLTAAGDFSLLSFRFAGLTLRMGFHGMLELESHDKTNKFTGLPSADIHFWRGVWGYSLALSLDRLARRYLGRGSALEGAISLRHESEHYTGSNDGGEGTDYSDVPHIGNFIMLDFAVRYRIRSVDLIARLQHKFFLPESGYTHGPGGDLVARWRLNKWVHPFASFFGEYLFGAKHFGSTKFPDNYLVRGMLGVILPSRYGDLYIFMSGDVGHRKGLAVYTEEATLGGGVRVAFY